MRTVSDAVAGDDLTGLLAGLAVSVPGIRGVSLSSVDGLVIAASGLGRDEGDQLAALSAGLFSLARKAGQLADGSGTVCQVAVQLGSAMLFAVSAGYRCVLTVLAAPEAGADLIGGAMAELAAGVGPLLESVARVPGAVTVPGGRAAG